MAYFIAISWIMKIASLLEITQQRIVSGVYVAKNRQRGILGARPQFVCFIIRFVWIRGPYRGAGQTGAAGFLIGAAARPGCIRSNSCNSLSHLEEGAQAARVSTVSSMFCLPAFPVGAPTLDFGLVAVDGWTEVGRSDPRHSLCGRGGIGRRAGFRFLSSLRGWRFDSSRPHFNLRRFTSPSVSLADNRFDNRSAVRVS